MMIMFYVMFVKGMVNLGPIVFYSDLVSFTEFSFCFIAGIIAIQVGNVHLHRKFMM